MFDDLPQRAAANGSRGPLDEAVSTNGLIVSRYERQRVWIPSVSDGFVGPAFAGEHRVLGLDGLVRTSQTGDLDELAKELPAEDSVVIELLIATLELGRDAV